MKLLAILRFIRHSTVLLGVGLVGGTVTAAGMVMLVTPGPGLVVIIAGLAILSTQFAWAERALDRMKRRAIAARDNAAARRATRRADAASPGPPGTSGGRPESADPPMQDSPMGNAESVPLNPPLADAPPENRAPQSQAPQSQATQTRAPQSQATQARAGEPWLDRDTQATG